ncbi:Alpha/Beta hydrolase protein [Dichotomocladium elegans]|nr:Alpha/Beta hydrolase protein [Dichotomocladium elegans]
MRALLLGAAMLATMVSGKKFTSIDLVTLPRPGAVTASPSGHLAVYGESIYHVDENKSTRNILLLDLESSEVSSLTTPSFDVSQTEPFFLDDDHVAFFQHTAGEPVDQLYVKNVHDDQEPYQLTNFPIDFGYVKYNPDKKLLAFVASVYADKPTLEDTKSRDKEIKQSKNDTGLVFDQLMIRHWDQYVTEKKSNIFVVDLVIKDGKYQLEGSPRNLLAGTNLQCPQLPLGDSSEYDISPDGEKIAFLSKIQDSSNAWQTSKHLYIVSTAGDAKPSVINGDIPATTSAPKYSPSGILAYLQMYVPQYEADRNRIVLYDHQTGKRRVLASEWDRSPSQIVFSADSEKIFAVANEYGRTKIFSVDIATEHIETLTTEHSASGVSVLPSNALLFNVHSMRSPNVAHTLDLTTRKLRSYKPSPALADALEGLELAVPEEFEFVGDLDDPVHGWMLKPVDFDPSKKYPVAFLIHGGPQGAWSDSWSTRWNYQIYPGADFVAVAINPHGSTGYGQKFCDEIQYNWGGHPYHDLMKGLDYIFDTYDFLDADRLVGLGASYGGYMINWLNGHTDRFKAFVNHDGIFSSVSSYYTSEELYFPEREFGGPPFNPIHRAVFERWSPSNFVENWKTPTLVIHGKIIKINEIRLIA